MTPWEHYRGDEEADGQVLDERLVDAEETQTATEYELRIYARVCDAGPRVSRMFELVHRFDKTTSQRILQEKVGATLGRRCHST